MTAAAVVLPLSPGELAQLGALAHQVAELRQKAVTALYFGLTGQAGTFAAEAQAHAAELIVLCAQLGGRAPLPPAAPSLRRAA